MSDIFAQPINLYGGKSICR